MTKRVPKLQRLLCIMQACSVARKTFKDCTLSEAWKLLRGTTVAKFRAHVETTGSLTSQLYTDFGLQTKRNVWIEYFLNAAGIWDTGWRFNRLPRLQRQIYESTRSPKLRTDVPKRLPAALLKRWDGYEPMNPDRNLPSRAELPLLSETERPLPDWGTLADEAYERMLEEAGEERS